MSQIKVNSIVPVGGLPSGASGGIIQIVHGETTTTVSETGGSFVDSGVTATITPSSNSSKILVVANMQWFLYRNSTETSGDFKLLRGSTAISTHTHAIHIEAARTSQNRIISEGGYTIQRLDSPSTTSATTYKVQFRTNHTGDSATMDVSRESAPSCITLYEVST